MVAKVPDGRGVPAKMMAQRRESDSQRRAARSIAAHLREQCEKEPSSGTHTLFGMAQKNMESLKPKIDKAEQFRLEARERREKGELDDETLRAELAPVDVAITVYRSLGMMLERADDKNALQMVAWATGTLAGSIEEGGPILSRNVYPDDPMLKRGLAEGRISSAVQLHDSVMSDDVKELAKRLGVDLRPVQLITDMR